MRTTIRVGVSTCGLAAGAEAVCSAIDAYLPPPASCHRAADRVPGCLPP